MSYKGTKQNLKKTTSRFDEKKRRSERETKINLEALKTVVARSVGRRSNEISSMTKLAEGGFNRVLQAEFNDGRKVLARLPYPMLAPTHYAVASEAATLRYLRSLSIPVPAVLGHSAKSDNEVGSEYLLLEKVEGICLGNIWYIIDNKARKRINQQILYMEEKLFRQHLPASGSMYHLCDLRSDDRYVPLEQIGSGSDQLVVGPLAQLEWHYEERTKLRTHMGPYKSFLECFEAPARREIDWCDKHGLPRLHVERHLRELNNFQELQPGDHKKLLLDYLELAPALDLPPTSSLSRPILRHPDLSPNNILINDSADIVAFIDWQHARVLPLCLAAGIPPYIQNHGDPESEKLSRPTTTLPKNYDSLSPSEKGQTQELLRKRLVHFLYVAKTLAQIPEHFEAMTQHGAVMRQRLYTHAAWPWEGDSVTLRHDLAQAVTSWPLDINTNGSDIEAVECGSCPLSYPSQYIEDCGKVYTRQMEICDEIGEMRDALGIDAQGWVQDDENYETSKEMARQFKEGMLEEAQTEGEKKAVREHFPFEDQEL